MNLFSRAASSVMSEVKKRNAIASEKKRILGILSFPELKSICTGYGISLPLPTDTDMITGKVTKRELGRKDYMNAISNQMSLDQLAAYCKKKKISTR